MTEPSVLTYARYFDLAKELSLDDILNRLNIIQTHTYQESTEYELDDEVSLLVQSFKSAAANYLSSASDEPLQVSQNATKFLQRCIDYEKPNLAKIYYDLLPDPHRIQKLKLKLPLLSIGGGDVWKDVERIKKGLDLDILLSDFSTDCEGLQSQIVDRSQQQEVTSADIMTLFRPQLEQEVQNRKLRVDAQTLEYLRVAGMITLTSRERFEIIRTGLPKPNFSKFPGFIASEEDFELEDEEVDRVYEVQQEQEHEHEQVKFDAFDLDFVSDSAGVKDEADHDLLSHLNTAVEREFNAFDTSTQQDREMDHLFEQYITLRCENSNTTGVAMHSEASKDMRWLASSQDKVSLNEGDELTDEHSVPPTELAPTSESVFSQHMPVNFKIREPPTSDYLVNLPTVDLQSLLGQFKASSEAASNISGSPIQQLDLPFSVPTVQDVMKESWTENDAALKNFMGKENQVITSGQLLWKEPGFRILDPIEQTKDLFVGDFCIDQFGCDAFDYSGNNQPSEYLDVKLESDRHLEDEVLKAASSASAKSPPQDKIENTEDDLLIGEVRASQLTFPWSPSQASSHLYEHTTISGITMKVDEVENASQQLAKKYNKKIEKQTEEPEIRCLSYESDSLCAFLDLRGKQFKHLSTSRTKSLEEMATDPIQCTQESDTQSLQSSNYNETSRRDEQTKTSLIPFRNAPELISLEVSKAIVLNNTLLQTKPLLVQFLERQSSDMLILIYRDLDHADTKGPDIILNANTCLIITNLQSLSQRPLPGQKSVTNLSPVHDQSVALAQKYENILILVHYITPTNTALMETNALVLSQMTIFCQNISKHVQLSASNITPLWIPCIDPSSTSELVNAWIWRAVRFQAHTNTSPGTKLSCDNFKTATPVLISEETLWELFLVKAGLNPMAAQVLISSLRSSIVADHPYRDHNHIWGLRKLMTMNAQDRHNIFDHEIGHVAVHRLNEVLRS